MITTNFKVPPLELLLKSTFFSSQKLKIPSPTIYYGHHHCHLVALAIERNPNWSNLCFNPGSHAKTMFILTTIVTSCLWCYKDLLNFSLCLMFYNKMFKSVERPTIDDYCYYLPFFDTYDWTMLIVVYLLLNMVFTLTWALKVRWRK